MVTLRTWNGATRRGFTLVELLVVMAIIAILAAASMFSVTGINSSLHVTQSNEIVQDIFTLARSTAIAHSHIVEVRFFQCTDPSTSGSDVQWRALQPVEILENGTEQPVSRATILPNNAIMSGNAETGMSSQASTFFQTGGSGAGGYVLGYSPTLPTPTNLGTVSAECRFRFMPDGSTDLALTDSAITLWYVTVYNERESASGKKLPNNYATIMVEPFTGAISSIRP